MKPIEEQKHVMVDLETLSTDLDCAVLTIGACVFTQYKGILDTFISRIDLGDAIKQGTISKETLLWWFEQEKLAQKGILSGKKNFKTSLTSFLNFLPDEDFKIWSNGASFDVPILEYNLKKQGLKTPWDFWNILDVRTIVYLTKDYINKYDYKIGVAHDALDDVLWQTRYVIKMLNFIEETYDMIY